MKAFGLLILAFQHRNLGPWRTGGLDHLSGGSGNARFPAHHR